MAAIMLFHRTVKVADTTLDASLGPRTPWKRTLAVLVVSARLPDALRIAMPVVAFGVQLRDA